MDDALGHSGLFVAVLWATLAWLGWVGVRGRRTGRMRYYTQIDDRAKNPANFRLNMQLWLMYFVCLTGATLWITARWAGAIT